MTAKHIVLLAVRSTGALLGLALAFGHSATASASESMKGRCVFDTFPPVASEPYYVDESAGAGPENVLRGVALFVVAREGLTKEWLELSIRSAFALREQATPGCLPKVRNVEVKVGSGGTGFWVYVGSEQHASELVRWATSRVAVSRQNPAQTGR